ncbi:helix-turn-helix domain-containing protein [Nocardioides sp. LMS-CY]|uniref:helix-turn-helix transcriptional regulator n=1 Tax=Nocardioides sp. (strain LMS-CY) TaxID=2840457 RepID=UPI001C007730|nr:helix-turn-helix domain-containing protein [Nocardioides sp. LMS-CY]QWF23026.1 helix-turn-helix domain-containing protein [Nocardioides sp. LMS-CY]
MPRSAQDDLAEALRLYARVARTGTRSSSVLDRLTVASPTRVRRLLHLLRRLGLLQTHNGVLTLPALGAGDRPTPLDQLDVGTRERLTAFQEYWRDWQPPEENPGALHGARGYWWHWWTVVRDWPTHEPLRMDAVMPADDAYLAQDWLEYIDRDLLADLLGSGRMTVRLIVSERVGGTPYQALVDLLHAHGTQVRLLDAPSWYTVYADRYVVAPESAADLFNGVSHLTEDPITARAHAQLFTRQWQAAAAWRRQRLDDRAHLIALLREGLHDHEIADRLGTTDRTVRRHVADLMTRTGARTRYQLGTRIGGSSLSMPLDAG